MKNVVLGVSGGIAAYKACELVGSLKKSGCNVDVILTQNAERFVSKLTFETLSGNTVSTDTFDRPKVMDVEHIALAKKADIFVVAPATANVIGKIAGGIADDMLTTTIMAAKCVKVLCPAMNTAMYENPIFTDNLKKLKNLGYVVIEPEIGRLACGDTGKGRLADISKITAEILGRLSPREDFGGKKILITAGATRENIDGVRYISNNSSGKMGLRLAEAATARGAEVTLVLGYVKEPPEPYFKEIINVKTTGDMYAAVLSELKDNDIIIKAAAPSDYRVKSRHPEKIKADELTIEFEKNPDIAEAVGQKKSPSQKLVIFNAETENLIENAKKKLIKKHADMVIANDVKKEGAGFDVDTNIVTILTKNGDMFEYPLLSKREVADIILDRILEL